MSRPKEFRKPNQRMSERALSQEVRECVRKLYRAPRLKVYGCLAELTRFGGSVVVDSGGGLGKLS